MISSFLLMAAFLHVLLSTLSLWAAVPHGHIKIASGVTPLMLLPRSLLLSCPITAPQTAHACPVPTSRNTAAVEKPIHYPCLTSLRSEYSALCAPPPGRRSDLLLRKRERIRTDSRDHLGENSNMNPHTFKKKPHEAVCPCQEQSLEGGRPHYQTRISLKVHRTANNSDWICSTERLARLLDVNVD